MDEDHRVRVPPELFAYLAHRAKTHHQTVSAELRAILRDLRERDDACTQEEP